MVQSFGFQISKEKRMPTFRFVGESKITFVNLVVQCLTNSSYAITSGEIDGETVETVSEESYDQPRQHIQKQRHYFEQRSV